MAKYKLIEGGVLDTDTGMSIPAAPGNRHWREFEAWRKDGNAPEPADPPPPAPTDDELADTELERNRGLRALIAIMAEDRGIAEAQLVGRVKAKLKERERIAATRVPDA